MSVDLTSEELELIMHLLKRELGLERGVAKRFGKRPKTEEIERLLDKVKTKIEYTPSHVGTLSDLGGDSI